MAISLVETLARHGRVNVDDLARRFADRYVTDPRRGYGGTAHEILQAFARGEPWAKVAGEVFNGTGSMGNGSAMRVAPLGAYFADDLDRVVEEAAKSAAPTHAHPEGAAGAIAVAVAAAVACREGSGGRDVLLQEVLERTPAGETADGIAHAAELDIAPPPSTVVQQLGNGSMVICRDTVPLCIYMAARHLDDYAQALWSTVAGLGDRDTTCAIVGGIVACAAEIPSDLLVHREPLDSLPIVP
jgi:ADP-ribosylglycohydrolase